MTRMSIGLSVATAIALASGNAMSAAGAELSLEENGPATRHEDPVGDATGDAPDIVACTISEPDDGPVIAISVEFASEPPLETDMETYTDVVFIGLVTDPRLRRPSRPRARARTKPARMRPTTSSVLTPSPSRSTSSPARICTSPRAPATCSGMSSTWLSMVRS